MTRRLLGGILAAGMAACPLAHAAALEPTPGYPSIQRAFLREDFATVASLAQTFITQHPDVAEVPRVWLWLVLSLDRLQRTREALSELDRLKDRLPARDPLWPEALFWEGELSRRALQVTRAKLAYGRLLEQHADSVWAAQAQFGLGLIYLNQQAFELAIGHLHEVALRRADTPVALEALLFEGLCYLKLGRFGEAVAIFRPLLARLREPAAMAQAAFYLGESFSGLKQYAGAIGAYQRALGEAEASLWGHHALFGLGWAYFKEGRCEESFTSLERYLELDIGTNRTEALFAQASCLMQQHEEEQALERFGEIVEGDPEHPLVLESALAMVDLYRQQEQFEQGKEVLHALLRWPLEEPARARIQLRLGAIALDQGNAAQGRTVFRLASENPDPAIRQAALSGLGDAHLLFGDLPAAKQFYEETIRVDPKTPVADYAAYQTGRIHLQLRAFDEAAAIFRRLSSSSDAALSADARLALSLTYLNQGERELARNALEAMRQPRAPGAVAARAGYYLALLALDAGDTETARRLCEEVVARSSKSEEAAEARVLLADLLVERTSVADAMGWLKDQYSSAGLSVRHRAKLAKRIADLARSDARYPEAIQWYQDAAHLLPSLRGEAAYRVASCYEEAGNTPAAMQWYQEIEQMPWRARGRLAAAKLLERQERLAEAEAMYMSIVGEQVPEAKVAQERLAAIRGGGR
jgi:tetratricopeptide (TPR) repeat protein